MFKGGAIQNPKYNPGIDCYSGFRKTSQGGGGGAAIWNPKKVCPLASKPESANVFDTHFAIIHIHFKSVDHTLITVDELW